MTTNYPRREPGLHVPKVCKASVPSDLRELLATVPVDKHEQLVRDFETMAYRMGNHALAVVMFRSVARMAVTA